MYVHVHYGIITFPSNFPVSERQLFFDYRWFRKTVAHAGKEVFGVEDNKNVVQWARAKCVYTFGAPALL